jgi:hypothetical protein
VAGGGLPQEGAHGGQEHEPPSRRVDRAEFLGEDEAGPEYWLVGGHVYAERDGHTSRVCSLAGWGRLRKLHAIRGRALAA